MHYVRGTEKTMLKLAVCDDNIQFLREMENILETDTRVEEVDSYDTPEKLLKEIEENQKEFDAIFMDIEFGREINGIQYVKKIFQKAPHIQLVYVTGYHDRFAQHIFLSEANLTGFLMKPLDKKILDQYLDKISERQNPKKLLRFSVRRKEYFVLAENVLYLESSNHRVLIHTEEDTYSVYDKLSNFFPQFPDSFIQCHKSFVINMSRIRRIEGNEIIFQDGSRVPVSKVYQEKVRKSYFSYIGKTI